MLQPNRPLAACAAAACAAAIALGTPATAPAKEHTAACPQLVEMMGRIRASLEAAARQRQRGSSLGAYQVLRSTATSMVRDSDGKTCGALAPTLRGALRRASRARTALDASVELDLGMDAALSLAGDGHLPYASSPPKLAPIPEAAIYGGDCPDLFPLVVELERPAGALRDRVATLLAELQARPRCPRLREVLQSAAPAALPHAVDSIQLDEPEELSARNVPLLSRCPELPLVVERIATAINTGAPQYNKGDPDACRDTYETAARTITTQLMGEGRCPAARALLGAGLARAGAAASADTAAWALRASFDAVLEGAARAAP